MAAICNKRVGIVLLGFLVFFSCTSQRFSVRAQDPVLISEPLDDYDESDLGGLGDLSIDLGGLLGSLGNATAGLGDILDNLLGGSSDFLSGLFGGSSSTNTTGNVTEEIDGLLDFVSDTFGIELGNLTGLLDGLLVASNDTTMDIDINGIVNAALSCPDLLSLGGTGLACLSNLDIANITDTSNCSPECKGAYEDASKVCPDLVRAIFVGTGFTEVCGQPLPAASTGSVTPSPVTPSPVTPSSVTPPATTVSPSSPDGGGVVQGGESVAAVSGAFGMARGLVYPLMAIAAIAL